MKVDSTEMTMDLNENVTDVVNDSKLLMKKTKQKIFLRYSKIYVNYIKNIIDWVLALIGLVVCSPIMGVIAILIKSEDGGPVLFKQRRTGKNGKLFYLYKFRSMVVSNDVHDFSKANKYTKIGKVLRKTSLDELPQLINIIRNEMSFIGPRPWIEDYSKYFTKEQWRRLDVKPGLSGLAQVKDRNNISVKEKIQYDIYYIDHLSIFMDINVILKTIKVVFSKSGAEMPKSGIQDELEMLKNQKRD